MKRIVVFSVVLCLTAAAHAQDWPSFRGSNAPTRMVEVNPGEEGSAWHDGMSTEHTR